MSTRSSAWRSDEGNARKDGAASAINGGRLGFAQEAKGRAGRRRHQLTGRLTARARQAEREERERGKGRGPRAAQGKRPPGLGRRRGGNMGRGEIWPKAKEEVFLSFLILDNTRNRKSILENS